MNKAGSLLVLIFAATCFAFSQGVQPFSADSTTKLAGRPEPFTGKIYFSPPKMRRDSNFRGHQSVMIVDSDAGIAYNIMPAQRMYMKLDIKKTMADSGISLINYKDFDPNQPCKGMPGANCQRLGPDVVNGRPCEKWSVEDTKNAKAQKMTLWLDKQLHYPIKSILDDGTTTELTNIKEGSQPASLFELPAGYREMGGMGGLAPH